MSKGISLPGCIITSSYSTCEDSTILAVLKYSFMITLAIEKWVVWCQIDLQLQGFSLHSIVILS